MPSVNKAIVIGHLGKDPESRFMSSGKAVCNFSLATSDSWKDKNTGEKQERTEWHNIVMYDRLAEIAAQYLKKGAAVYIEGRLQTRKWQDKNGQDRYTTEIVANEMKMLGGKSEGDRNAPPPVPQSPRHTASLKAQKPVATNTALDDDIPF